jgi:hypothetical protein
MLVNSEQSVATKSSEETPLTTSSDSILPIETDAVPRLVIMTDGWKPEIAQEMNNAAPSQRSDWSHWTFTIPVVIGLILILLYFNQRFQRRRYEKKESELHLPIYDNLEGDKENDEAKTHQKMHEALNF